MKIFKDSSFIKRVLKLFVPLVIQEIILVFTSSLSSLMLGPISNPAVISGVFAVNQIFFIFNMIVVAVSLVGNLFIAQHYGQNSIEKVEKDYFLLLKIIFFIGLIFFIICEIIPYQLVSLFAENESQIIEYGVIYLRIFAINFLFTGISVINYTLLKNISYAKFATLSALICLALTAIFNSIFLYSSLDLGVKGAGYSIIIARGIELILSFVFVNISRKFKFNIKKIFQFNFSLFKDMGRYGLPILLAKLFWVIGSVTSSIIIGKMSADIINANAILGTAKPIIITISTAMGIGVGIEIGRELGANKIDEAKKHGSDVIKLCFITGIVLIASLFISLPISYGLNPNLSETAKKYLLIIFLIYATQLIPQSYNSIIPNGVLNSGGDTIAIALIDGLTSWVTIIPIGFILIYFNYYEAAVVVVLLDEILKTPLNIFRYRKFAWARNIVSKGN